MEVRPMGLMHVVLKKYKDHFTFNKCLTKVQNIIIGTLYIDHIGDLKFDNH